MRSLSLILACSLVALTACSESPDVEPDPETEADALTSRSPIDGKYTASCSDKYASIDLSLEIAKGKVKNLTGKVAGRNGKLRPGTEVIAWRGDLATRVQQISGNALDPNRVVVEANGTLDFKAETLKLRDDNFDEVDTVKQCESKAKFPALEILAKSNPSTQQMRSITLTNVGIGDNRCVADDTPLDELGNWTVDCSESDGAASADGLENIVRVLRAAKPTSER